MAAALFLFCLGSVPAGAMSIRDLQAKLKSPDLVIVGGARLYITGIGEGILATNAGAESLHKAPLFCQPAQLALNTDNLISMMNQFLKKLYARETQEKVDDFDAGTIIFNALADTFPCQVAK
jgi:hypothetical protein